MLESEAELVAVLDRLLIEIEHIAGAELVAVLDRLLTEIEHIAGAEPELLVAAGLAVAAAAEPVAGVETVEELDTRRIEFVLEAVRAAPDKAV